MTYTLLGFEAILNHIQAFDHSFVLLFLLAFMDIIFFNIITSAFKYLIISFSFSWLEKKSINTTTWGVLLVLDKQVQIFQYQDIKAITIKI